MRDEDAKLANVGQAKPTERGKGIGVWVREVNVHTTQMWEQLQMSVATLANVRHTMFKHGCFSKMLMKLMRTSKVCVDSPRKHWSNASA